MDKQDLCRILCRLGEKCGSFLISHFYDEDNADPFIIVKMCSSVLCIWIALCSIYLRLTNIYNVGSKNLFIASVYFHMT